MGVGGGWCGGWVWGGWVGGGGWGTDTGATECEQHRVRVCTSRWRGAVRKDERRHKGTRAGATLVKVIWARQVMCDNRTRVVICSAFSHCYHDRNNFDMMSSCWCRLLVPTHFVPTHLCLPDLCVHAHRFVGSGESWLRACGIVQLQFSLPPTPHAGAPVG